MKVTWITFDETAAAVPGVYSPIASVRFRVLIPLQPLEAMGHRVQIVNVRVDSAPQAVASEVAGDVVILSKVMFPRGEPFQKLCRSVSSIVEAARRDGRKIIVDVCDDLFGLAEYGDFLRQLVQAADMVVTSSASLAQVVQRHCSRPTRIAEDPYEGPGGEPRYAPPARRGAGLFGSLFGGWLGQRRLRLLWYGHGSNFTAVVDFIPQLERLVGRRSVAFNLVTAPQTGAEELCAHFNQRHAQLCELRFTPWTIGALHQSLDECDLVVIPTHVNDPTKLAKSSNRLVHALWSGRFVIAHPVAAYRTLESYAWIGDDLVEGLEWALANPRAVTSRLRAGQQHVRTHFSPQAIAQQWEAAIREVAGESPVRH